MNSDVVNDLFPDNQGGEQGNQEPGEAVDNSFLSKYLNAGVDVNPGDNQGNDPDDNPNHNNDEGNDGNDGGNEGGNEGNGGNNGGNDDNVFAVFSDELIKAGVLNEKFNVSNQEDLIKAIDDEVNRRVKEKLVSDDTDDIPAELKEYKTNDSIISKLNTIKDKQIAYSTDESNTQLKLDIVAHSLKLNNCSDTVINRVLSTLKDSPEDLSKECESAINETLNYYTKENEKLVKTIDENKTAKFNKAKQDFDSLMTSISNKDDMFSSLNITERERNKARKILSERRFVNSKNQPINEIEHYIQENPIEYKKNVAMLFAITNGFKDFKPLVNLASKTKVKESERSLERLLRSDRLANNKTNNGDNDWIFK